MKAQFVSNLLCQPLDISRERGRTILGTMLHRLRDERPAEDIHGDPLPTMQVVGDVAVIPIHGVLMVNVPDWVKKYGFGLTDANDIEAELDRAVNDPDVAMIVQDVASPGGHSIAGNKLFDLFEAARRKKPVFTWCPDGALCCSAAYNSACCSNAIICGPYAELGSIGSYLAYLDDTEFWKMMGFSVEVFRSGEYKGIGEDPLNEARRAYLQASTDTFGARIRRNVKKYQKEIADADLQGQSFVGWEAFQRGFAAETAKNLTSAIKQFRKML